MEENVFRCLTPFHLLRKVIYSLSFICGYLLPITLFSQTHLEINTDFPGGNIKVERISNDTVFIQPDLRDTEGDWFYWYFEVKGGAGKNVVFQFGQSNRLAAFGPAVSTDKGKTWKWMYDAPTVTDHFSFSFPPDGSEYHIQHYSRNVLFPVGSYH